MCSGWLNRFWLSLLQTGAYPQRKCFTLGQNISPTSAQVVQVWLRVSFDTFCVKRLQVRISTNESFQRTWGSTGNDVQVTVQAVYLEQIKAFTTDIIAVRWLFYVLSYATLNTV